MTSGDLCNILDIIVIRGLLCPFPAERRSVFVQNKAKDLTQMAIKRRDFLEKAYEPFTKKIRQYEKS